MRGLREEDDGFRGGRVLFGGRYQIWLYLEDDIQSGLNVLAKGMRVREAI